MIEVAMVWVKGRPFRCHRGANVFTKRDGNLFTCNGCNDTYEGSPMDQTETIVKEIAAKVDYLARCERSSHQRYENSRAAGFELAMEIRRFLEDPLAVGTQALDEAYGKFMGQHAGNFTDSVREAATAL